MSNFCVFLEKTTRYGKIFKILFRKFTWRHRLTLLCSNVVKFVSREIGEIVRYLPDKKFGASQTVATTWIAPKICNEIDKVMFYSLNCDKQIRCDIIIHINVRPKACGYSQLNRNEVEVGGRERVTKDEERVLRGD